MSSSNKPSYLGTLNAIVNGERRGFEFLDAWATKTKNTDLAGKLKTVALREAEHAASFEKRMCELGYSLKEKEDPKFKKTMEIVSSSLDDAAKFEKLGVGQPEQEGEDKLLQLLADKSIDPQTAALLGRFIAEERDSGRILREAYQCAKGVSSSPDETVTLAGIQEQLTKLTEIVCDLQSKPTAKKPKVQAIK
ncbi:MAG: hypothetical protein IIB71_03715 [Proteobacteria bacterium]|nr:hypothetical protein [Pseudomonadota bacterium]